MTFYTDANEMTKEAMDNTLKSMSVMTKGFQQIATETTDFAKRSFEQQGAAVEKIAQAKSVETAIGLQNEYAKSAYEAWVGQARRMSEIYAEIAKEVYKPFERTAAGTRDLSAKAVGEAARTVETATETAQKKAA